MFVSFESEELSANQVVHYIKIKVMLGNWWDNLLYDTPEIVDYMFSVFEFNHTEKEFSFKTSVATSSEMVTPGLLKSRFYAFIDDYERNNPGAFKLIKTNFGAKYSNIT